MFPRLGIGAVLDFQAGTAVAQMANARRGFDQLQRAGKNLRLGMSKLQSGLPLLTMAVAGLAIPLALGAKSAMDYESAMSTVHAITLASAEDMAILDRQALDLSQTTVFTATQVANAMETLGRAGFTVQDQIAATGAALSVAAIEGLSMQESADIIAGAVRGMGLDVRTETTRVADVLALTAARSNTNMAALGESFRYAAAQARSSGIELEQLSATIGILANYNLRASMSGTGLTTMMIKLGKPSKNARGYLKNMGVAVRDLSVATYGLFPVIERLHEGFQKLTPRQKEKALPEIFGIRGMKAADALFAALDQNSGALREFDAMLRKAGGSAELMARIRLNNLGGAITILRSIMEAFAATVYKSFQVPLKVGVQYVNQFATSIVTAFRAVQEHPKDLAKALQQTTTNLAKMADLSKKAGENISGYLRPEVALAAARGVRDAIVTIKDTAISAIQLVQRGLERLGVNRWSDDFIQRAVKIAALFVAIAGAAMPVLGTVLMLSFAWKGLSMVLGGFAQMAFGVIQGGAGLVTMLGSMATGLAAAFAPILKTIPVMGIFGAKFGALLALPFLKVLAPLIIGAGIIAGAFALLRKQGESFMDTLKRIGGGVFSFFINFIRSIPSYIAAARGFFMSFRDSARAIGGEIKKALVAVGQALMPVFQGLKEVVRAAFGAIGGVIQALVVQWRAIFAALAPTVIAIFQVVVAALIPVVRVIAALYPWIIKGVGALLQVAAVVVRIAAVIAIIAVHLAGAFLVGIAHAMKALVNFIGGVVGAIRGILPHIASIGRAIGRAISGMLTWAIRAYFGMWRSILGFFGVDMDAIVDKVKSKLGEALDWIREAWNKIKNVITSIGDAIWDKMLGPIRRVAGWMATALSSMRGLGAAMGIDNLAQTVEGLRAFSEDREPVHIEGEPKSAPTTDQINQQGAENVGQAAAPMQVEVTVQSNPQFDINAVLELDGADVARAYGHHELELKDRAGIGVTPWQRQAIVVHGADPARG